MITAESFPTPHLALRSDDPAEASRVRAFAQHQADAAESLRRRLAAEWPRRRNHGARLSLLREGHADLVRWRYEMALQAPGRLGAGLALDVERFRVSIRDGGPNADRLGYLGRLRTGATWDPETQLYRGGAPTPASEVMLAYGQHALDRFAAADEAASSRHGDVLLNIVSVPDGRRLVASNRLVRGAEARKIAVELVARVAARGRDTSQMEVGGEPIYVVTAEPDNADALYDSALTILADAIDLEVAERLTAWQNARYLLYQAPRTKKGSDAVTRTYLVAVGAVLFGMAPVLDHDVDLRCMVLGQHAATELPADAPLYAAAGA